MSELPPYIKTEPLPHQAELLPRVLDRKFFALFWDPGLGKTKLMIDVASYLFLDKKIDAMLVVAPNSVYSNWPAIEIPLHMAAPYMTARYKTRGDRRRRLKEQVFLDPSWGRDRLRVLAMSYDSIRTDKGFAYAQKFVTIYRTMIVADESTVIKTGKTEIAREMKKLRDRCHRAWIATGTPVAQSPFDIHSQVEFLDEDYWREFGLKSYHAFKQAFGEFKMQRMRGGRQFPKLIQHRKLDQLHQMIQPISSRLLKEDSAVKLPPKRYVFRTFEMTPYQQKLYDDVKEDFCAMLSGVDTVDAPLALTRMMRLQQITSGHVTVTRTPDVTPPMDDRDYVIDQDLGPSQIPIEFGDEFSDDDYAEALAAREVSPTPDALIPDSHADDLKPDMSEQVVADLMPLEENPRIILLREVIAERPDVKHIIFCKFRRDVENVCQALGDAAVRYDGAVRSKDREAHLQRFMEDSSCLFFVANIHALSMGVTLVMAKRTIYYSNSLSLEKRLQSEDRFYRIGQTDDVEVIDLAAEESIDEHVVEILRKKFDVAAQVTGDKLREWLGES